jgi:hypothetical protein
MYSQDQIILHLAYIRSEILKDFFYSWSENFSAVGFNVTLRSAHMVKLFNAHYS